MPTSRDPWLTSLARVLRLAGALSASATTANCLSTSSSTPSSQDLSPVGIMSASMAAPRAFSRARLVRSRPGFVPSVTTSTCAGAAVGSRRGIGSNAVAVQALSSLLGRPTLPQHHQASSSTPRKAMTALDLWFTTPSRGASGRSLRLFSSESAVAAATTDGASAGASAAIDEQGVADAYSGSTGEAVTTASSSPQHDEAEEDDGPAPFKVNLLEMDNEEVEEFLQSLGEPKYRAKQVLKWMYEGGAGSFDDMNNIPKALRAKLAKVATVGVLEVAAKQVSKDGTRKMAYRLADGQVIESVLMPYSDGRRTACISSQVGCAMGCVFCATGQMGFKRQLSSAEIFEQAYRFSQELAARGDRLSNVVFMGMGEPLANYKNVMEAVRRINTELGIGARHITISTVGLVPRISRLAQENLQVKLAVSLHAANDRERSALLPVNRRFPLSELMDVCQEYVDASGRRMTFEWALIQGQNDSAEVASELGRLLRPLKGMCHVNIIPLNPTAGYKGGPSMAEAVNQFVEVLARHGVPATPRTRRGIDIDAGCGQLTVKVNAQDDVLGMGL